jgi:hypothetical protein
MSGPRRTSKLVIMRLRFLLEMLAAPVALAAFAPGAAFGQSRFAEAEASAHEVAASALADEVAVLLADCTNEPSPTAKRTCITNRRRAGRNALRATYLVELPAAGHVRYGAYEPSNGGFRIYVDGFRLPPRNAGGLLATAPTSFGLSPANEVVAEGFALVPWITATTWLEVNRPSELTLRVIVRLGEDFEDLNASDPRERYGIRLHVVGVQIFSNASGSVLVDTFASRVPAAPPALADRTRLWSQDERAEALFVASDGTQVNLNVRIEPREPGSTSMTALLMQTVEANSVEIFRVTTPCCSSSIDVRRHGAAKVLAIVTEQSADRGGTGRGRVILLTWDADARLFVQRAEWAGTNGSSPPAWVLDPGVDP